MIRFGRLPRILDISLWDRMARFVVKGLLRPKRIVYSVYQDLIRGRKTDIDFVTGEIWQLAPEQGMTRPYNAKVVKMVHKLEQLVQVKFPSRNEVIAQTRNR